MFDMSANEAVGAYLRTVREGNNLTLAQVVARMLREDPNLESAPGTGTISKIENAETKSPGLRLIGLINRAIQGNPMHIQSLAVNDRATRELGVALASQWLALSIAEREYVIQLAQSTSPDAVLQAVQALSDQR